MTFLKNKTFAIFFLLFVPCIIQAHDVLVELKGAYFLSADQIFKSIYDHGCGEFGAELTAQVAKNVYGFLSVDIFNKKGHTAIFNTPSKFFSTNFGLGLKYFIPLEKVDFYVGLGVEPTYLKTVDSSTSVQNTTTAWNCGGIAKVGAIVDISHALFLDFFIDYSFVQFHFNQTFNNPVQKQTAVLNGALFGVGFGYRFN